MNDEQWPPSNMTANKIRHELRNETIEECARAVESFLHKDDAAPTIDEVAAAIRRLKNEG